MSSAASNDLDAYFIFNETMRGLVDDYFLPSLPPSIAPKGELVNLWSSGNYQQDNYRKILRFKTDRIIRAIEEGPPDSIFLFCDVDLVFLKDPVPQLKQAMQGLDLAFQREWSHCNFEANTGFQVIRRNEHTFEFYRRVLWHQENRTPANDQHWVNQLLRRPGAPAWGLLPSVYSSGSNGGLLQDSVMYHANNTVSDSMRRKLEALDQALSPGPAIHPPEPPSRLPESS